jgi:enamine deaminase RidA (YjgF/YER057c/UK114 family)
MAERSDIRRLDPNARRSRAVIHGGVHLAGRVADDRGADIALQTSEVLAKVDDLLAQAGTEKSRLLTAQVWLRTMDDVNGMNVVWDAWAVSGATPTRCCGKVELADPGLRVEVVVTAAL